MLANNAIAIAIANTKFYKELEEGSFNSSNTIQIDYVAMLLLANNANIATK